jgi:hypothetical protein
MSARFDKRLLDTRDVELAPGLAPHPIVNGQSRVSSGSHSTGSVSGEQFFDDRTKAGDFSRTVRLCTLDSDFRVYRRN